MHVVDDDTRVGERADDVNVCLLRYWSLDPGATKVDGVCVFAFVDLDLQDLYTSAQTIRFHAHTALTFSISALPLSFKHCCSLIPVTRYL